MKGFLAVLALIGVLAVLMVSVGCASGAAPSSPAKSSSAPQEGAAPRAPAAAPAPGAAGGSGSQASNAQSSVDRMVIRNASLRLVVTNVDEVLSKAAQAALEAGGFVVTSESRDAGANRVGKISVRVPADRLDSTLQKLKGLANRVDYESTTAQDVTEEYVDQDARIRTLQAQEQQYLKLLDAAKTTEDVIKVTQALTQVRDQIERTQARLNYLRRSADMALISVDVTTSAAAQPVANGDWNALETVYSALRGLVNVGLVLVSVAIWFLVFSPIWLPLWLLIRWLRRRGRRGAPPVPPVAPAGTGTA